MLAAVASYLDARASQGTWSIRIEDIDPPREPAGAADDILRTLERTGLTWDGTVVYQSANRERHEAVIEALSQRRLTYYCRCSRRTVREAASRAGLGSGVYPGTCRTRALGHPGALRILTDDTKITATDRLQAPLEQCLENAIGDFVIRRRDNLIAYQLAVVVDDADAQITDVVRGIDLWDNTPRQIWLQRLLGFPTPRYLHFPVLVNAAGDKLSKQAGATRVNSSSPAALLLRCLKLLQQNPPAVLAGANVAATLDWARHNWQPDALKGLVRLAESSVATQQNPLE